MTWQHPVKPCLRCGGEKPKGAGVKFCDACLTPQSTLEDLIADQRKEMQMGRQVHRQRFGAHSRVRARTLSIEAMAVDHEGHEVNADEWADPTFDALIGEV